jgi:hypothetical protein
MSVRARWYFNAGMLIFSIIVVLAIIEVILRVSVGHMPLNYQKYLPADVKIMAQTTKDELVPESYVAILGDSYASGWGDWYRRSLDESPFGNPPFHSADIIHSLTGLDVLTFARPGQGSFDGIAYFPIRYLRRLRSRGFALPDPSVIVIYFYEGNDLKNNLRFLNKYWSGHDSLTPEDVGPLVKTITAGQLKEDGTIASYVRKLQFFQRLYVAKFLYVLANDMSRLLSNLVDPKSETNESTVGSIQIRVGGKDFQLPGPLESSPVYLSEPQIDQAVGVFESSLHYLMEHYSKSKLLVVYLPAPTTSYQLVSAKVPVKSVDGSIQEYPADRVEPVSDLVCQKIADATARLHGAFLDTRPPIRAAGRDQLVHGPLDWYHFNEIGYRILGKTVAQHLMDTVNNTPDDSPARAGSGAASAEVHCAQIAKHNGEESARILGPRTDRTNLN